jgi:hypothetical protein
MNHDCITDHQGREACTCSRLHTANSDDSSPHAEARDLVELALDFVLILLAISTLTFTIFSLIGFWSNT